MHMGAVIIIIQNIKRDARRIAPRTAKARDGRKANLCLIIHAKGITKNKGMGAGFCAFSGMGLMASFLTQALRRLVLPSQSTECLALTFCAEIFSCHSS